LVESGERSPFHKPWAIISILSLNFNCN
jgi:hypothetical protein